MSRFIDIHAEKRKALNLFQAVEPCVKLLPIKIYHEDTGKELEHDEIPGHVARMSHASTGTTEDNIGLTGRLQKFDPPHGTPLEFHPWLFKITGVSKSCLTQFDRNRIGIGFVQMSGRYMDSSERGFVYTAYSEQPFESDKGVFEKCASYALKKDEEHFQTCLKAYENARARGCTKQDARKNLPLAMATGTYVHLNSRSLKTFFNERLRPSAEWEIRKLAQMMFDIVYSIAPTHFVKEKSMLDGCL